MSNIMDKAKWRETKTFAGHIINTTCICSLFIIHDPTIHKYALIVP